MSDVREVSEWHEAMEGSLTVAGERLSDAVADLIDATGMPAAMVRVVDSLAKATVAVQYMATHARLSLTPEYQELKRAAEAEERDAPDGWFARNRLALHVEVHMPPIAVRTDRFLDTKPRRD